MTTPWERLLVRMEELRDLSSTVRLMEWDQTVMMPPRGAAARARMSATLEAIAHARLTDPEIGGLLDNIGDGDNLGEIERAHVRVLRRDYERATRIPESLVRALATERGLAYHAWTEARPADDFERLRPHLERLIALKKEEADAVGYEGERYDALLDVFEPEMTTKHVEEMFRGLVKGLKPLAEKILDAAGEKPAFLTGDYDEARQKQFCTWLAERLGYDFQAGRLDTSPHPFTIMLSVGDVRQTTRTDRRTILNSIFAAIHETGHALYEQGLPEEWAGLPAGETPSLGMHESQSRLWENQVGRSRPFADFLLPHLKDLFPSLGNVAPEEFHRGANHPERSTVRVHADEVTYNLHVALRFELELALFRDALQVVDLPDAWNDAMERHLGIRPDTDRDGVMQDMHWSIGAFGYFPTYTLGTLYAAAFYATAERDLGGLDDDLRRGDGTRLLLWLRDHIHSKGFIVSAQELGHRVLGAPLTPEPFLDYLSTKYGTIYETSFA